MTNATRPTRAPRRLPFALPERPLVTRIRQVDAGALLHPTGPRTQPMAGFDDTYVDIVDYIVRITHEIWVDCAVGRIYETYAPACAIHTASGVVRSVEEIVASTVITLDSFPDGEVHHLNVAWFGDERDFYTSHLGWSRSTNCGPTAYGPATNARVGLFFVADCVSRGNMIHTEWLARDNGALVRQLGFDLQETAARIAEVVPRDLLLAAPPTRLTGGAALRPYEGPRDTPAGYFVHHFHDIWNLRRFDHLPEHYDPHVIAHWPGARVAMGLRNLGALMLALLTSLPDATIRVEHLSWSDETDGVIVAVRWRLEGTTRPGGLLGPAPNGRVVFVPGMSHFRFGAHGRIVEEWTVFDEVGVLAQAYRG